MLENILLPCHPVTSSETRKVLNYLEFTLVTGKNENAKDKSTATFIK